MAWTYSSHYKGLKNLIDPRKLVAVQIAWQRSNNSETEFSIPEPDNYNRAIFAREPVAFDAIRDQVIYKDTARKGWITLCYVPPEQADWFDQEIAPAYLASWQYSLPIKFRQPKSLLQAVGNRKDLTDNQRLYTMGYYETFATKYFCNGHYVAKRLGEARADLIESLTMGE